MTTMQPDLNHSMRTILIDWLIEVAQEYNTSTQTVQLAVNYIDRFLSITQIRRQKVQLVGISAMLAAAKFEEIWPPGVDDYVYIADNTYPVEEVKEMERTMLRALDFHLVTATPNDFLKLFLLPVKKEFTAKVMNKVVLNCQFLVELCLQTPLYTRRLASEVAALSLWLARRYDNLQGWTRDLEAHSGYTAAQVVTWARPVHNSLGERVKKWRYPEKRSPSSKCLSILKKYKREAQKHKLANSWLLTQRPLPTWKKMLDGS